MNSGTLDQIRSARNRKEKGGKRAKLETGDFRLIHEKNEIIWICIERSINFSLIQILIRKYECSII